MNVSSRTTIFSGAFLLFITFNISFAQHETPRVSNYTVEQYINDTTAISKQLSLTKKLRHTNTDSGIILYQDALLRSRKLNYTDGLARSLTGLGLFYMDKGEYDKSMQCYNLAKPFCGASRFNNGLMIVALYNNIAALYGNRGIMDTSTQYYFKALEMMEQKQGKDTNLLLLIYSNIGARLAVANQFKEGLYYLEKGEKIAFKANNQPMLAKMYVHYGLLYQSHSEFGKARYYALNCLELLKGKKDPGVVVRAYCIVGNSYREEGKPRTALNYYLQAFDTSVGASKNQLTIAYEGIGSCYYALKDYPKAEGYYLQELRIAREEKMNEEEIKAYEALVKIYADTKNYEAAYHYRNTLAAITDSTMGAEKLKTISQLEIKYRSSEKDKEIVQNQLMIANQENQIRQKNFWIIMIAGGSILLVALFVSLYRNRNYKQKLEIISMQNEQEVAQLKAMMNGEEMERTRIARELHDGIMVQFSSVQMNMSALMAQPGFTHTDEFEDILSQLESATKELRKSAHNLMPDMLLSEGLAEATHYFCKTLERSARTEINFQVFGEIPAIASEYQLMIYRIIQELLQNIVKHAKADSILVQMNSQPDLLSIAVEDNGIGFDSENLSPQAGMGIKSMKERIASVHGTMSIHSERDKGTSVYIELETAFLKEVKNKSYAY